MARELVEQGGVGESADAVWQELRNERSAHLPAAVGGDAAALPAPAAEIAGLFASLPAAATAPGPVLVHTQPNKKEVVWLSGHLVGDQLKLFG